MAILKKKKEKDYFKIIKWSILGAVILILIIILLIFSRYSVTVPGNFNNGLTELNLMNYLAQNRATEPKLKEYSPVRGSLDAPITIFEYSSFGCPYSAEIQPIIKNILKKYPNEVKLVWKDFPLEEVYEGSTLMHQAARCAQNQGMFWQYHDKIWNENLNGLDRNNLKRLAENLDLNINSFNNCLDSSLVKTIIDNDTQEADDLYISGTPHFYINSQELLGQFSQEDFERIIEIELNR